MKRYVTQFVCGALFFSLTGMQQVRAQEKEGGEPMQTGEYEPTWATLARYECPTRFHDPQFAN